MVHSIHFLRGLIAEAIASWQTSFVGAVEGFATPVAGTILTVKGSSFQTAGERAAIAREDGKHSPNSVLFGNIIFSFLSELYGFF